jgi:ATP-dependent RNA helicase DDX10/DBP4
VYEALRKFKMGLPLYELQGHQKQKKRMAIYFTFCEKRFGVLVATNIAARGLDFPLVDWVLQLDVPETLETYVHRVGRTARFRYEGKSLMLVTGGELAFIEELKGINIKIHKIQQNPEKYLRIESSLQSICSEHQDVKYLAQRALISYLKFVYKAANKQVFNINRIDVGKLANSYGLQNAPLISIRAIKKEDSESQSEKGEEDEL